MRKVLFGICLIVYSLFGSTDVSARDVISFNGGWEFKKGPFGTEAMQVAQKWSGDWEKEASFYEGDAYYRKKYMFPESMKGKRIFLRFEGVGSCAEVYINGYLAGTHKGAYSAFACEISGQVKFGQENEIIVKADNTARPDVIPVNHNLFGVYGGIYRPVWLVVTDPCNIVVTDYASPGVYVTQKNVSRRSAEVTVKVKLDNGSLTPVQSELENTIYDGQGRQVKTHRQSFLLTPQGTQAYSSTFKLNNPHLWQGREDPYLYKVVSRLWQDGKVIDEMVQPLGLRNYEIVAGKGFFLNGKKTMFKGVCNHHDLGPLGGIANDAGIRRQIRILKDMGCNAIRTSHNMPAPELIKACDEMGMMIMAESFDEWKAAKVQNGYHKVFDEWVEKDLVNLIHQYRNNPSVVMWCIGNEVPDQWNGDRGPKLSRFLQDICHREDPTRPVTQGMDAPDAVVNNNMAAVMDVAGFNYRPHKYQENYKKLPQQIILGSETASTVSSRGVYKFPVVRRAMQKYDDHQSSSYDVEHCGWSNLPEDDFIQHEDLPYCIGEFVWTGFDYLGEPTPYYTDWPSHSSLFGIIDLAGLPKDRYYLYRSHWNKDKETLHILPHWNWEGREGEVTPVFVYTNYPSAELFINGKSQGKRTKDLSVTVNNSGDSTSVANFKRQQRYRLMWMDTKYEPGTVKVVAYDKDGKAVAEKEIHTAGKPDHIELVADRSVIDANGKDLSFVTVKVVDKEGNLCPLADNEISFKVKGAGTYRAGANGNPASLESFQTPKMKVFSGMMTAIVQSTEKAGKITLEATGKGLKKGTLLIESK